MLCLPAEFSAPVSQLPCDDATVPVFAVSFSGRIAKDLVSATSEAADLHENAFEVFVLPFLFRIEVWRQVRRPDVSLFHCLGR